MALLLAAEYNLVEIVEFLLSMPEINVNLRDKNRWTALMYASRYGHVEIVKLLLSKPDLNVNLQSEGGWTALMIASWKGKVEIVKLLLSRSKSVYTGMSETLTRSTNQRLDVNIEDESGETALMLASKNGHTEIVKLLLSRPEIDVNLRNVWVRTALMIASQWRHTEIVSLLENHK